MMRMNEALDATREAFGINICEQTVAVVVAASAELTRGEFSALVDHMPRSRPHLACRALAESDCEQ